MGAWGSGAFENDAALDYVDTVRSPGDVTARLVQIPADDIIDSDESSELIVAAEFVAALRGHPAEDFAPDLAERIADWPDASLDDYEAARAAVSAVLARSELLDLWAEEGSGDWNRAMTGLLERLNRPAIDRKAPPPLAEVRNRSLCMFCDQQMGVGEFHQIDVHFDSGAGTMTKGGWAHLACLNAALHPKHMVQTWKFDQDLLQRALARSEAEREARLKNGC